MDYLVGKSTSAMIMSAAGYYPKQMTDDKLNGAKNPTSGRAGLAIGRKRQSFSTKTAPPFMASG